jgi:O-antigen/teichoic acid export membrane protein
MSTGAFHEAADIIPLILLAYGFHAWTNLHNLGIFISGRTSRLAIGHFVGAGVALLGYWLLIPRYLAWGAAIATVVSFAVRWAVVYRLSQGLWYVRYDWKPVFKTLALGAVAIAIALQFSPDPIVPSVTFRTAVILCYFTAVWFSGLIGVDERDMIREAVTHPSRMLGLLAPQGAPPEEVSDEVEATPG